MAHSPNTIQADDAERIGFAGHDNDPPSCGKLIVREEAPLDRDGDSNMPSIDVVHVAVLHPMGERYKLSDLPSSVYAKAKRELVFQSRPSCFLQGDLVEDFVHQEALRLLRDLSESSNKRTAIIFVAYDLGALVLKEALTLAARFQHKYSSIFWNTSTVVFSGCPHRSMSEWDMSSKLSTLLSGRLGSHSLRQLTPNAIEHLVDVTNRMNSSFIDCKIALRARIFHLYAGQAGAGMIDPTMDNFTATMGLPSEIAIQERSGESLAQRFPGLSNIVGSNLENLVSHPRWLPIEQTLLGLAAPPRTSHFDLSTAAALQPLLDTQECIDWDNFHGAQALVIRGLSHQFTHSVADVLMRKSMAKLRPGNDFCSQRCFSFSFDSRDPLRRSIPDMITSILVQAISGTYTGTINPIFHVLQNLLLIRCGWTLESSISTFKAIWPFLFEQGGTTIALYDFDECDQHSRTAFMNDLSNLASRVETPIKLVITLGEPNASLAELEKWPMLNVDDHAIETTPDTGNLAADLTQSSPIEENNREIQEHFARLATMERNTLHTILGMIVDHTSWPENPSRHSLSQFIRLLSLVSPSDTPAIILDKIVSSDRHADQLCWVLGLLLHSYRPLSLKELATLLEHYNTSNTSGPESPERHISTPEQLSTWICMFIELRGNRVTIRPYVRKLLENQEDDSYIRKKVWNNAHQKISQFCLASLSTGKALEALRDIVLSFETHLQEQQQLMGLAALVVPCDENILLYVVQALPYHLSKCASSYRKKKLPRFFDQSSTNVSMLWAKTYWAMSSPLSRTPETPESALSLCASLGLVTKPESLGTQCMSALIISGTGKEVLSHLQLKTPPVPEIMELFLSALQANDQNTALDLATRVVDHPEWKNGERAWPPSAIWTAVWLNMVKVTGHLLDNGVPVEINSTNKPIVEYYPSILYLASILNHHDIVGMLLARGAGSKAPSPSDYGSFQAAAYRGHVEVVQKYLKHDATCVDDKKPFTALYIASEWGAWECVRTLVNAHADVNYRTQDQRDVCDENWTPLAIASKNHHKRTMEALLVGKADVNAIGPYGMDTALWFTTRNSPNVECTLAMLKHNANPNHPLFSQPPLLIDIVSSSHDAARILPVCDALRNATKPIDLNVKRSDGQTALMIAANSGKLDFVKWLITNGANIGLLDQDGKSALYYGTRQGHVDIVVALLDKGALDAETLSSKRDLLLESISNPDIMRHLLSYGADPNLPNADGDTAINKALEFGKEEVVKLLIENGADINHQNQFGRAPIFEAVRNSCKNDLVRLLAESGAKMDGMLGNKTLVHLALCADPEILETLLRFPKRININAPDGSGFTALHYAVRKTDIRHLKALIRAGADLNTPTPNGDTALHIAARQPTTIDHLKLLLTQPDIEIDKFNPDLGSPVYVAARTHNIEGVRALLNRGVDVNLSIPNIPHPTLLLTVLAPSRPTTNNEDVLRKDVITRMLVCDSSKKIDVTQTVPGSSFHTALSAACFSSGPSTIKLLIEKGAEVDLANNFSGRLAHHFAAANGCANLRAVMLSYRGDMMISDKEQKNCLHWAAQFGNFEAIEYILEKLKDEKKLAHYINRPDSDGWTPLCWAARPYNSRWEENRSERPRFTRAIKLLLDNGARTDVTCKLCNGTSTEELIPFDLAQQCGVDEEIITLLRHNLERPYGTAISRKPDRIYALHEDVTCDICFNAIFGLVFKCDTCPDYTVCGKCLPHRETFHTTRTQGDGGEHNLERLAEFSEYLGESGSVGEAWDVDMPGEQAIGEIEYASCGTSQETEEMSSKFARIGI